VSDRTVDAWVRQGLLPPPRLRGGKLMWRWSEVDQYLDHGGEAVPDTDATATKQESIREATQKAIRKAPF
jgi:hypothetical protein